MSKVGNYYEKNSDLMSSLVVHYVHQLQELKIALDSDFAFKFDILQMKLFVAIVISIVEEAEQQHHCSTLVQLYLIAIRPDELGIVCIQ
jgi:hypothetical protein